MKKVFLLLCSVFLSNCSFCQSTNIEIEGSNGSPEETSVFINPVDASNIVAGANLNNVYQSTDGGHTWNLNTINSSYTVWGDPCVIADTVGNFYYIHLTNTDSNATHYDRVVIQKSTDKGVTWSNGTYTGLNLPNMQDKPWGAVDPKTNYIYVTWTQFNVYETSDPADTTIIFFSRSTDGGLTWSTPQRISHTGGDCTDSDGSAEGAMPVVGPNGDIYVVWARNDSIWLNRSADYGDTWLNNELLATDQPGGWDYIIPGIFRCNGLPVIKCDFTNGASRGTLYLNWSDQRNGNNNTDIWFAKSTDGGNTWSQAVRVNDDTSHRHQFFTWMDIDQSTGYLYFIFYDRRNYTDMNTDVYLAYSVNGGTTFTNQKISDSPFDPNSIVFFGDYIGISASKGEVTPIWMRLDSSDFYTTVWTTPLDMSALAANTIPIATSGFTLHQNTPNPFYYTTKIEMQIDKPGFYTMNLYDIGGRKVADIFCDGYLMSGQHSVIVNPQYYHLSAGTYYYSLQLEGEEIQTKKFVLVK